MRKIPRKVRIGLVGILVAGVTALHYGTRIGLSHHHIFYRELYYLPLILSAFWFGVRGALITSFSIAVLYLPFILESWDNFSVQDFHRLMGLLLYTVIAVPLGILRDRERAERRRVVEAESLAGIGKALSSVAHDFKTPLIAIGGFAMWVQRRLKKDDACYDKLNIVIGETRRLENMVNEILDFSKPLNLSRSVSEDLREIIQGIVTICTEAVGSRSLTIDVEHAHDLPIVPLDRMRMEQALMNLVLNAIQATPDGERVNIRTSSGNGYVSIEVRDRGCGIPADSREEIFSPFFTTKKGGTGLGLPIAKKIIAAHGGRLEVRDNVGKGSVFTASLPIEPC